MNIDVSINKPSIKHSVWSLLLGILSCFYSFCCAYATLMVFFARLISSNVFTNELMFYSIGAFVLCLVVSIISLILRKVSLKHGVVNKMTNASKILCILSIAVSIIFNVITLLAIYGGI
ncbi:MAG: hypothetical protein U0K54_01645 [Acutalibacteraceae bacterium]|nr:hypothetical protein [Acutalibacteraceae bacterium]